MYTIGLGGACADSGWVCRRGCARRDGAVAAAGGPSTAPPGGGSYSDVSAEAHSGLLATGPRDLSAIVTGALYSDAKPHWSYAAPTSGQRLGLAEYSTGVPGEPGVDIGPYGSGYGADPPGVSDDHADGIPPQWAFPSEPVRWLHPEREDYYGPEGATPYVRDAYSLFVPDHDVLMS